MNPDGMVALLNYRVRLVILYSEWYAYMLPVSSGGWCHS